MATFPPSDILHQNALWRQYAGIAKNLDIWQAIVRMRASVTPVARLAILQENAHLLNSFLAT